LAEVCNVTWTNSRSDAQGLITLELGAPLSPGDECKTRSVDPARPCIQLRSPLGIKDAVLEDWFELIEVIVYLINLVKKLDFFSFKTTFKNMIFMKNKKLINFHLYMMLFYFKCFSVFQICKLYVKIIK
jgi:hypothetical protein